MSSSRNALSAAVFPSCAAWNSIPTRRSGQNTSGANSSAVSPAASVISPNTNRSPTPTATSATPRVASSSSTNAERNAMRSVAIAERRCAAPSSAIRSADPPMRPSARSVGMPATRSSSRDCRVVIAASDAADRSEVTNPMSTMKIGMSGNAISTINRRGDVVDGDHHHRGRGQDAREEHRWQVCGEVRPQTVEAAGDHRRRPNRVRRRVVAVAAR